MRHLALPLAAFAALSTPSAASESGFVETISAQGVEAGVSELLGVFHPERSSEELDREMARQLETVRSLAALSPRTLLPVAVTLDRAYHRLRAPERVSDAFRVRALLAQLIELHEAGADGFGERAVTADLYVLLAGTFFEQQRELLGIKYLQQALELDPTNATALLVLSKVQELRGKHIEALALLEELRALGLGGPEARLRLALNAARFDREDEAAAELAEVTKSETPSWIRLVAHQEKVRIELDRQRFGPAGEAIHRARTDFPQDCTLRIAALYLAERSGRTAAPELSTDSLTSCGNDAAQSARMRYASRDPADIEPVRARLAQRAEERLEELGNALKSLAEDRQP